MDRVDENNMSPLEKREIHIIQHACYALKNYHSKCRRSCVYKQTDGWTDRTRQKVSIAIRIQ